MIKDALLHHLFHHSMFAFKVEEKTELKTELGKMFTFIEKLNELDTTGVETLVYMRDDQDDFRKDEVEGQI